jgi:hypothetical protein
MQTREFLVQRVAGDHHHDARRHAELFRSVHRAAIVGAVHARLHDDRATDAECLE